MAAKLKKNSLVILLVSISFFIVDRLTKYLSLKLHPEGIFYLPQIGLKSYLNQGIAFSLPLNNLLIVISSFLIILLLAIYLIKDLSSGKTAWLWPLALIIIGSSSNLIDRLKFDGVIDFIDVWFFPAFNLADCYIVAGVIWLIWLINKSDNLPKQT
jgi:signal peptidase II